MDESQPMYNEGIMYKDKVKKSQGESIANTQCSKANGQEMEIKQ